MTYDLSPIRHAEWRTEIAAELRFCRTERNRYACRIAQLELIQRTFFGEGKDGKE